MTISTLVVLAVCRTYVIHEPCIWHSSPRVLRVRASDQCIEGHRFNSCRGLRFFRLCPVLVTCWSHHFSCQYSFATLFQVLLLVSNPRSSYPLIDFVNDIKKVRMLCYWVQRMPDRENPHATVRVIALPPKIFVVRARKSRTGNLLN